MAEIEKVQEEIKSEFFAFDDWMDKYNYLIEMGKNVPEIDEKYKDQQHLISGCQSRVWLHARHENGLIRFTADSDAVITKGLVSLLLRVFDGQSPDAIMKADMGFIDDIGLKEHLSPTRSNGLNSMIKQIKLYAMAFKAKEVKKEKE